MSTEVEFDPELGAFVENDTAVPTEAAWQALGQQHPLVASMVRWTLGTQMSSRQGNLFDRNKYMTPNKAVEQMKVAHYAVEYDDVVGGIADSTESLAIGEISFWNEDPDEQDVWNQIAGDLNLDARLREMWRDDFTYSQFYVGVFWGRKTYKVRGKSEEGKKRKKQFKNLRVPLSVTLLDPLKIAPLGMSIFNRDVLVYLADRKEAAEIKEVLAGGKEDDIMRALLVGVYDPNEDEKKFLKEQGYEFDVLFLMDPKSVFRHTQTRPAYHRLAAIRMKNVFELLDMKNQLKAMDRAHLIGGTNFIVLIKKGTDAQPGRPEEIAGLQEQVRTVARVPIIVGDHRLSVEIITPNIDVTLDNKRYATLDARIMARIYGMFLLGGSQTAGGSADKSADLTKVVARGMESRRKMIRRTLEAHLFKAILERNDDQLQNKPMMKFNPTQIALGFDSAWASFLLEMRAANEISRETILSQFDLDQADEALMLEREDELYDDIFMTQVPFSTPNPKNPNDPTAPAPSNPGGPPADSPSEKRRAGRRGGGARNGGGAAPGSGQGQPPVRPRRTSDDILTD